MYVGVVGGCCSWMLCMDVKGMDVVGGYCSWMECMDVIGGCCCIMCGCCWWIL